MNNRDPQAAIAALTSKVADLEADLHARARSHERALAENVRLKEENAKLRRFLKQRALPTLSTRSLDAIEAQHRFVEAARRKLKQEPGRSTWSVACELEHHTGLNPKHLDAKRIHEYLKPLRKRPRQGK